jgi:restriction system protein
MIEQSSLRSRYTATGKLSGYEIDLTHNGLDEIKHLFARDTDILEGKIHNQVVAWEKKWMFIAKSKQAEEKTERAKNELIRIEEILLHTLSINNAVDWNSLKNTTPYKDTPYKHEFIKFNKKDGRPATINKISLPKVPKKAYFLRPIPILSMILGQKNKVLALQEEMYSRAYHEWKEKLPNIVQKNKNREESLKKELASWKKREQLYLNKQKLFNNKIDNLNSKYDDRNDEAIEEYCEMVLNNSEYPESFPKDFELQYNSANGMLLIDYILPRLSDIPTLNIIGYIKSRDEFTEKHIGHAAHSKLFDSCVYQIVLRTIHEIFEADVIGAIESINFNGIVNAINPATGHIESNCIVSMQVLKQPFLEINLESIDPKQCFKSLKGIGSTKLSSLASVKPILELDKSDKRFTNHYEVVSSIDDSCNLAAMDWEDFEHLIREIFEKEFATNGGEVKVTQASSDGGVDAIAFDPDPIRGGKIIIQAKRYTNTVGVSAVRDLYGTVMNEGATKGILVTTAEFGPDSYNFVKDKPLTLLSGGNLLYLLEKHGHRAKIDLKEAKKILKEQAS